MQQSQPGFAIYLLFNGNCQKAFRYYQECLGGELEIQTLADSPDGHAMDPQMQSLVVNATLTNDYLKLVGTDLHDDKELRAGNSVAILIFCNSFRERSSLINKLVERNFCSHENRNALINVTDKFRINWVLSVK